MFLRLYAVILMDEEIEYKPNPGMTQPFLRFAT